MLSTYLAYRHSVTKFYDMLLGRPPVVTIRSKSIRLGARPEEARRRRQDDTDGSRRRAAETKLRHEMH
ncbi:hypothetical protein SAZ10_10450 [Mesorhizobium sp. BAC0120]|uniref:hypothetical protein n=1 Tax=Mesorhizobium sp. BAC0120 TaxID=3090670 RepID=UPI00298C5488|nr:hypothetical protein [Mesorhizobium sp. BAC0120]MDW6022179.1 hypothetical protein [Mesorhizobium sp. BAC0120]